MQDSGTPSGDWATPVWSPQGSRSVRTPTSGGAEIQTLRELQASVFPDASMPKLYRVFWTQWSPATAVRVRYGTQSAPSQYPGEPDAFAASTIGAAANPHANATAAMIFMSLSVGFWARRA